MKKLLYLVPFLALVACGGNKGGQTPPPADSTKTTTTTTQQQPAKTGKSMAQYFDEFKAKEVPVGDDLHIKQQTDNFVSFNHSPKEGEIIGVTNIALKKLVAEDGSEFILYFMFGCVEGSCNLDVANLKLYDSNWKDVTMTAIAGAELQEMLDDEVLKLRKDKKSQGFDSFYAVLNPDEYSIDLLIVRSDDQNLGMDDAEPETRPFPNYAKLYWNRFEKTFVFDDPYAG